MSNPEKYHPPASVSSPADLEASHPGNDCDADLRRHGVRGKPIDTRCEWVGERRLVPELEVNPRRLRLAEGAHAFARGTWGGLLTGPRRARRCPSPPEPNVFCCRH
jgi:hypothetical protein